MWCGVNHKPYRLPPTVTWFDHLFPKLQSDSSDAVIEALRQVLSLYLVAPLTHLLSRQVGCSNVNLVM